MRDLKALLWDVDGTLADTERDGHRVAFNVAFSRAGLAWDWGVELYGELLSVTGGKERIRYFLERYQPEWNCPGNLDAFIADLHALKSEAFVALMAEGRIPLRGGVLRLVSEAAQQGIRLAIVTTTTPANVEALIRQYFQSDSPLFEVIAAGDVVAHKKPAPDIYQWALDKLQLDPGDCVAIEDSNNGLQAARGAGIETVVITVNDYTANEDFSGASLIVDQLGEADDPCRVIDGGALYVGPAEGASPSTANSEQLCNTPIGGKPVSLVDLGLLRRLHGVS